MTRGKISSFSQPEKWVRVIVTVFEGLRKELLRTMKSARSGKMSELVSEEPDDSIYGLDIVAKDVLLPLLTEHISALGGAALVAEGIVERVIKPQSRRKPEYRLLIDPVDGTRCLMYGKRSAWALAALAPDKGAKTRLSDAVAAVMVELPTPRAALADSLWAVKGKGVWGESVDLRTGRRISFKPRPS